MPTLPKPKPQFFKYVERPANVGDRELSQARPVYITDLPSGDSASEVARLEGLIDDLTARVATLEEV